MQDTREPQENKHKASIKVQNAKNTNIQNADM